MSLRHDSFLSAAQHVITIAFADDVISSLIVFAFAALICLLTYAVSLRHDAISRFR